MDGKLAERFASQGYVGPLPLFTKRECRLILRRLRQPPALPPLDWYKGGAATARFLFELARYGPILDRVTHLIGPDVMLWGVKLVDLPAQAVHPWHSDIETTLAERSVSVWIGLEHANQRSGLRLLSGSHWFGLPFQQQAHEKDRRRGTATDQEVLAWAQARDPDSQLVEPAVRDGQALLFDGRLWHMARNHRRQRLRTALLLQYAAPDAAMRVPDLAHLEWPFRFRPAPFPPCIMMRGTGRQARNRLVPGPAAAGPDWLPLLSTRIQPLELPRAADRPRGWQPLPIFNGATRQLAEIGCHQSVLGPGETPHEPHVHPEEEIVLVISGVLQARSLSAEAERHYELRPGSAIFYPAGRWHTHHNPGPDPAVYLVFKWRSESAEWDIGYEPIVISPPAQQAVSANPSAFAARILLETATPYLARFQCHWTTLQPGAGYPPHVDAYDVAILTLRGTVETLGQQVGPHSVIFYAGGEPHGMKNIGDTPAEYLVFEFLAACTRLPLHDPSPSLRRAKHYLHWLKRQARRLATRLPGFRLLRAIKSRCSLFRASRTLTPSG